VIISLIMKRRGLALNWEAGVGEGPTRRERIRPLLEQIRADDPNFSLVLLEDFLYALYAQAHTLRGGGALERLSAYLKPPARAALSSLGNVREVRSVIVGAMRYLSVDGVGSGPGVVRLVVEFESNYTEIPTAGPEQSYYARESWTLSRARGVMSRTPDRARVFTCPSCGAPLDSMVGGRCQYCQATVDTGQLDWVVEAIAVASREARGPLLTGTTEEKGTDMPTVVDRDVTARFAELTQRDPQFVWPQFQARVAMIFGAMQVSWSSREWPQVRPFVSDNLFQMLAYWIEAYKRAQLRNITEGARVEQIELARVSSDKFFDALTVRLFASSLDYTIADADGRVVGGNRSRPRRYSEYWTLIRGASKVGPSRTDGACPSCGAPLRIEMAGHCEYCRAKVTSGEFDWVLSRIEQDDVYEG
jgi:Tim44-like domain